MASPNIYPSGVGGSTGPTLTTSSPLYLSGDIWYVSSTSAAAADAASPRGKERIRPLATLAQAVTNAAAADIIVVLENHTETITSTQTLGKAGLYIVGEGSGSTRPKFTRNIAANGVLFDITAAGVVLQNLYFPATVTTASTGAKVRTNSIRTHILDCYFEAGTLDDGAQIEFITGAGQDRILDTTVISTATAPSDQPESAIKVTNAITDLWINNLTINGGSSGWANPYAFNGAAAVTVFRALQVSLLNDSDVTLATGTTGWIQVGTTSGSARVVWAA